MWLRARSELAFDLGVATPFLFRVLPPSRAEQEVLASSYAVSPPVPVHSYTEAHGNRVQRLVAGPGPFRIWAEALVDVPDAMAAAPGAPFCDVPRLPAAVLPYLRPSRYCESDRLLALAQEIVGDATPGYDQVLRISEWTRRHIRYTAEPRRFQMSALEVHRDGEGVCRELAHLVIALCRALAMPARLVAGYLRDLEPMDFHAWVQAYVGGRWYTFDPTETPPFDPARVTVAVGRDAADVAVFDQFGPPASPHTLRVHVERLAHGAPTPSS